MEEFLINSSQKQNSNSSLKNIIMIMFSYSFIITLLCIVCTSLLTWQFVKFEEEPIFIQNLKIFKEKYSKNVPKISFEEYRQRCQNMSLLLSERNIDAFISEPGFSIFLI